MKSLYKRMGGTYHMEGDYLVPDLVLPDEKEQAIGIWGQRYRHHLEESQKPIYTAMLLNGTLNDHIAEIGQQAEEMFERVVKQIATRQGITERLKADDQMAWVSAMNHARSIAEEAVLNDLIYC